jgi:hypothetical protein
MSRGPPSPPRNLSDPSSSLPQPHPAKLPTSLPVDTRCPEAADTRFSAPPIILEQLSEEYFLKD